MMPRGPKGERRLGLVFVELAPYALVHERPALFKLRHDRGARRPTSYGTAGRTPHSPFMGRRDEYLAWAARRFAPYGCGFHL